ncbi:MAG TPA: hotdog domain-containing protein [Gemmatirosa sp.]
MSAGNGGRSAGTGAPPGAFEVVVRIEWVDVDLVGIVRYGAYPRLLDVAEAELFRAAGLAFPRVQSEYGLVLVRRVLHLEYLTPARYDALVRVALWVVRAGRSALTLGIAVRDGSGDAEHVLGYVVVVAVDATTLAKAALPRDLVARVSAVTAVDGPVAGDEPGTTGGV